jgi:DNA-binding GntR family transcriptional regulator
MAQTTIAPKPDDVGKILLQRDSLIDQVQRLLKADILSGALAPDKVFTVGDFAQQLGVSRTPVREAILQLQTLGLVEILPNTGFRVVSLSAEERRDIIRIRELLEIPTLVQMAGSLSAEAERKLRRLCQRIVAAAQREDSPVFMDAHAEFHVFLIAQVGNNRLARLVSELQQLQQTSPTLPRLMRAGALKNHGQRHQDLLEAIIRGDKPAVERLSREHFQIAYQEQDVE